MNYYSKNKILMFSVVLEALLVISWTCYAVEAVPVENVDFSFYGKLIDQNTNPIPNVAISYTVDILMKYDARLFTQQNNSTITTNDQGCFTIQEEGIKLLIKHPIEVPGYEYSYETNPKTSFGYASVALPDSFVATEANPFVFTLRKKNVPAFLLGNNLVLGGFGVRILEDVTDDINKSVYLVPPWVASDGSPGYLPGGEEPQRDQVLRKGDKDLLIEGALSGDETQYDLEISPITPNSGIILSDDFLREAPGTGYQSSVQLSVPRGTRGLKKYLYIKLDNGKFYGRLDLEIWIGSAQDDNSENQILFDTWINPSSSRNLEYDYTFQSDEDQWRYLLYKLGGHGHFGDYVLKYEEDATELVEEFGLSSLPDYENEDQFLADLNQLRAAKDAANPQWWQELE